MFGTNSFFELYEKYAEDEDFLSVRLLCGGAQKILDDVRKTYVDRFGLNIQEGYGLTETSPCLSANAPGATKPGTVGRLLPEIEYRLEDYDAVENSGRLVVKGPNIMLGYYLNDNPGVLQPPEDGWFDTNDLVRVDDKRYVTILGRADDMIKIGGEKVFLGEIEDYARAVSEPTFEQAAVDVTDEAGNRRVALFSTDPGMTREKLAGLFKGKPAPLGLPKGNDIIILDTPIPKTGSGKKDKPALRKMFNDVTASRATVTAAPVTAPQPPAP